MRILYNSGDSNSLSNSNEVPFPLEWTPFQPFVLGYSVNSNSPTTGTKFSFP